jgi:membrane-associated phospholipid phosphatase
MLPLFYYLRKNCIAIFSVRNLFFHMLAWIITYILVITGFDWAYYKYIQTSPFGVYLFPAVIIGGLIPMIGLPLLYMFAKISKRASLLVITWAIAQAAMLGWIVSSLYKSLTGRVQPPHAIVNTLMDTSRDWNFGFMEHGIFWGWPSSHTTVAFAMSFALITLYPKNKVIFWSALFYALYIGLGVSTRIHWFSEFIAGAIIGAVIGIVVGKSFRSKL